MKESSNDRSRKYREHLKKGVEKLRSTFSFESDVEPQKPLKNPHDFVGQNGELASDFLERAHDVTILRETENKMHQPEIEQKPLAPEVVRREAFDLLMDLPEKVSTWRREEDRVLDDKTHIETFRMTDPEIYQVAEEIDVTFYAAQLFREGETIKGARVYKTAWIREPRLQCREFNARISIDPAKQPEIRYDEHPYHMASLSDPMINTDAALTVSKRLLSELPQPKEA